MNTETTEKCVDNPRGFLFFDADCPLCRRAAQRWGPLFQRRGFRWVPLQTAGVDAELGITQDELRREMKLRLAGGLVLGGVDAWARMFTSVWWLWPLGVALRLPGIRGLGRLIYRVIARNRHRLGHRCRAGKCSTGVSRKPASHRHSAFFELP